jgi:HAD superfamily hydrolase (TIGR01549 family)
VKEVLEGLRGDGYRLIIISNSSREFLRFQIKELEDYFDQVFSTTSDFAQTKHHAELYSRIYSLTGVTPQQAVHVGDRLDSDFHPPRKAGAIAYHLDRSGRNRGEYVVRDLVEFREKLNRFDGCR